MAPAGVRLIHFRFAYPTPALADIITSLQMQDMVASEVIGLNLKLTKVFGTLPKRPDPRLLRLKFRLIRRIEYLTKKTSRREAFSFTNYNMKKVFICFQPLR